LEDDSDRGRTHRRRGAHSGGRSDIRAWTTAIIVVIIVTAIWIVIAMSVSKAS